jgi:hypothetical protein
VDLELRGKKVLITGASKGIGLACAHGFAAEGAAVHVAARGEERLKAACEAIVRQHNAQVHVHPLDLGVTRNVLALAGAAGEARPGEHSQTGTAVAGVGPGGVSRFRPGVLHQRDGRHDRRRAVVAGARLSRSVTAKHVENANDHECELTL